jgi:alpha-L-rhamnosidase
VNSDKLNPIFNHSLTSKGPFAMNLSVAKNWLINHLSFLFLIAFLTGYSCSDDKNGAIMPVELTCDYSINPIGIDHKNPSLSWILKSEVRNQKQTAYRILVAGSEEKLNGNIGDLWDSEKVNSDRSVHVGYDGRALQSGKRYWWKVCAWDKEGKVSVWSKPAFWEMGLMEPEDWKAQWIGLNSESAPMLRKEFEVKKTIRDARVYISGLGYYELSINGSKIGDHVLDPGQTDYEQRTYYTVYDVTAAIRQGKNTAGVILGNGWYNQTVVNTKKFGWGDVVYGKPRMITQIHIVYTDGTEELIISDKTWKGSTGPILSDNIYLGEYYDARLEKAGWDKPGYDDSKWKEAELMDSPGGKLEFQKIQPIKKIKTVKPIAITNPRPGIYVYNMGQNFAGRAKLKITAPRGKTIQLRFAETVFDNGMIDPASTGVYATNTVQTDQYTFRGSGTEIWEPRFTYHGFQYVEMTGFPGTPTLENLEGVVVNTALEETGTFECSDQMINKIHSTILWTTLSNIHGIVTDCPHRERCQWLGDILAEMMSYNFHSPLILEKFVQDIETGRRGGPPNHIAPGRRTGGKASSDWGSTFIQLPYYLYLYYSDISVAGNHYEGMTYFINYLESIAKDYIISEGWGDLFEPGSVKSKRTPNALTSTAFFYYDADLMREMAEVLGEKDDQKKYTALMDSIKTAFTEHFYNKKEKSFGSQTADALALNFGLVPKGDEKSVAESMMNDIVEKYNGHHSTGHMGTRYIYGELSRFGYGDVAQKMLNQTAYPSFGELFQRGATTIWEYWGEKIIDETSAGTRSRNHPFQGGFDVWFYNGIAGINPDPKEPGFKHIILKPQVFGTLNYARASYRSLYGLIVSDWKRKDDQFSWHISVPVNTTAEVYVPSGPDSIITESGKNAKSSEGLKYLRREGNYAVYKAGSGEYRFDSKLSVDN